MKYCFLLAIFFIGRFILAQDPVLISTSQSTAAKTFAVIVGISDYQSENIPDLKYAHADALAFLEYLQSNAGGNIEDENIQVLINENATSGKIVAALGWLIEACQPGDKAYIYFSGHGDVERISKFQRGYLLTYDSPPRNYLAGAFPVFGLQDIVSTLSDNDVQVIMISDACRSGKLAGNSVNGTQATTALLSQQFANEIKILSCQSDEFSLEGRQWGNGRGCFSYHLLDALTGLADRNQDNTVKLLELERYLQDKVSAEAAPHSQIPMTVGSKGATISKIDETALAELIESKKNQSIELDIIDAKTLVFNPEVEADSLLQSIYQKFTKALDEGHLLDPAGSSANDYFDKLISEAALSKMHGLIRRNFATELQDESQQAINEILNSDPGWIDNQNHETIQRAKKYPAYLAKAAELLGEDHYLYSTLKAKEYYFKGFVHQSAGQYHYTLDEQRIKYFLEALEYDSTASFVHYSLGVAYTDAGDLQAAIDHFDSCIEYSPGWYLPYNAKTEALVKLLDAKKALKTAYLALSIDSSNAEIYRYLGEIYAMEGDFNKSKEYAYKGLSILENTLENDIENISNKFIENHQYILTNLRLDYKSAENALKKIVEHFPDNSWFRYQLGRIQHFKLSDPVNARKNFLHALELDSFNVWAPINLAQTYYFEGNYNEALSIYNKYHKLHPEYWMYESGKADIYHQKLKDYARAKTHYLKWYDLAFSTFPYTAYSTLLKKMGETDNSLELLDAKIREFPDYGYLYTKKAQYLKSVKADPEEIIHNYKLSEKHGYPAHIHLAQYYLSKNDFAKAEHYFKLVQMQYNLVGLSEKGYNGLAYMYMHFKKYEEAIKYYEKNIENNKFLLSSHYYIGKMFGLQNKQKEVENKIELILKEFEPSKDRDVRIAVLHFLTHKLDLAYTYLESSMQQGLPYKILADPFFNAYKDDSRWQKLIEKYYPDKAKTNNQEQNQREWRD